MVVIQRTWRLQDHFTPYIPLYTLHFAVEDPLQTPSYQEVLVFSHIGPGQIPAWNCAKPLAPVNADNTEWDGAMVWLRIRQLPVLLCTSKLTRLYLSPPHHSNTWWSGTLSPFFKTLWWLSHWRVLGGAGRLCILHMSAPSCIHKCPHQIFYQKMKYRVFLQDIHPLSIWAASSFTLLGSSSLPCPTPPGFCLTAFIKFSSPRFFTKTVFSWVKDSALAYAWTLAVISFTYFLAPLYLWRIPFVSLGNFFVFKRPNVLLKFPSGMCIKLSSPS